MKNKEKYIKAFSLIELLITIAITLILLSMGFYVYSKFLSSSISEQETTEKQIEKLVALELMRLDMEHIGYGVGKNPVMANDYRIFDIDNNDKELIIYSTLNNNNNSTIGWRLCDEGTLVIQQIEAPNNNFVYVDSNGYVRYIYTDGSCPSTGKYVGYPFEDDAIACNFNGTNFCTKIVYYLSDTNLPSKCNPNTYNLLRKVNNSSGEPLLSCVADIVYSVDYDTDGDGKIDKYNDTNNTSVLSPQDLRNQVIRVSAYILYQEAFDPNANFQADGTDSNGAYLERNGIKLYLPNNYQNYRWKVIKLSVKPMSIIK